LIVLLYSIAAGVMPSCYLAYPPVSVNA